MKITDFVVKQWRLEVALAVILSLLGLVAYLEMPRAEDPHIQDRFGFILAVYPGSDPLQVEKLVAKPLEDRLKEVNAIKKMDSTIRNEVSVTELELKDSVTDIEKVWNDVRVKMNEARNDFPQGVSELTLSRNSNDVEAVMLAVTGSDNRLALMETARKLKTHLLRQPGVARVEVYGDPKEQVTVRLRAQALRDYGLSREYVMAKLQRSNSNVPGGSLDLGGKTAQILTDTNFRSIAEIRELPLALPNGEVIPLSGIAQVEAGVKKTPDTLARYHVRPAVILGVVPQYPINIVTWGRDVRNGVKQFQAPGHGIKVEEVAYQPKYTEDRLQDLLGSLLTGMASIALFLLVWMGWRVGAIVAISVPAISLIGLAVYFAGGGILHQISLVAFLISLGQFIDNVIVIVDSVQRKIDAGVDRLQAVKETVEDFRRPMIFATGTGIAAFIPMLASQGVTAEFTLAIPLIAVITMVVSYFFAIFVVPNLAYAFLKPRHARVMLNFDSLSRLISNLSLQRPWLLLGAVVIIIGLAGSGFILLKQQFFPSADRDTFVVQVEMPDGTHISQTDQVTRQVENFLLRQPEARSVATFIGQGVPAFYYNISRSNRNPALAQLMVMTGNESLNHRLGSRLTEWAQQALPEARIYPIYLEQGPVEPAPVEIRVRGDNLTDINAVADDLVKTLKQIPGSREPHHTAGQGAPALRLSLADMKGARLGVERNQLALALLTESTGVEIGKYSGGDDLIPIRLEGESANLADIQQSPIANTPRGDVLIRDLTREEVAFLPSVIHHRDGQRVTNVRSFLQPGYEYTDVMRPLQTAMQRMHLPPGVRLEIGGQAEGAEEANLAIFRAVPFGFILMLVCLLLEFNSFTKMGIIFASLPLVITGIVPGLLLGGAPFGFMSLLGLLAVIGIVVNNSILLQEAIEDQEKEGHDLDTALREALRLRIRPIFLTTVLTIVGLVPMAVSNSSLWPPMAWAMISGLIASTIFTLFFIPALYKLIYGRRAVRGARRAGSAVAAALLLALGAGLASPSGAEQSMTLSELQAAATRAPVLELQRQESAIQQEQIVLTDRAAFMPKLGLEAQYLRHSQELHSPTPFGLMRYGQEDNLFGGVQILQPLWDESLMIWSRQAADQSARAAQDRLEAGTLELQYQMSRLALQHWALLEQGDAIDRLLENLRAQKQEIDRRVSFGQLAPADRLKVEVAMAGAEKAKQEIATGQKIVSEQIRRFVPEFGGLALTAGEIEQLTQTPPAVLDGGRKEWDEVNRLLDAQAAAKAAVETGSRPTLELQGRWVYSDQGLLDEKQWWEGAVVLRWPLFEGLTRQSRTQIESLKLEQLEQHREDLRRQIQTQIANAREHYQKARFDLETLVGIEKTARQVLASERVSYRRGRSTISDLLDAERVFNQIERDKITALSDSYQAVLEIQWAQGAK